MIKQVTAAVAATRVLTPGPSCKLAVFQNNGSVAVRLSFDGNTDAGGQLGTAPTTSTGFRLPAGAQLFLNYFQNPTLSALPIWAISEGGAIVLDIITDDKDSK